MSNQIVVNATKIELVKILRAIGAFVIERTKEVGQSSEGCQYGECEDHANTNESYYSSIKEITTNDGYLFLGFQCESCTQMSFEIVNAKEYYKCK